MTLSCFSTIEDKHCKIIHLVDKYEFKIWFNQQKVFTQNQLTSQSFVPNVESISNIYNLDGVLSEILFIIDKTDMWSIGSLYNKLPNGSYSFYNHNILENDYKNFLIGFALGAYSFKRYKTQSISNAVSVYINGNYQDEVFAKTESIYKARDMINTPAEDMGPAEISMQVKTLADKFDGDFLEIVGEDLLKENYPGIYHVGKASNRAPRLIKFAHGNKSHKKITLVGKGVAFDTGGLDIKSNVGMIIMHKDMGGAAHVVGLANLILTMKLPVFLTVYIAAVDNAIGPNAYRPSDVIKMRNSSTVQINNTDAEGRVILADVLYEASSHNPDLLLDFATLTGAARVAVGTEIGAFFTNNKKLADKLYEHSEQEDDPLWQLPLYKKYNRLLESSVADMSNMPNAPQGGAISAALFLERFIKPDVNWVHLDIMAWNVISSSGRPKGGEAMGIRAVYELIKGIV